MAFLRDVSNTFWNYVSPRKTQQRRDKEFKVPVVPKRAPAPKKKAATPTPTPLKAHATPPAPTMDIATPPESRELSPESRIKKWTTRTPSPLSDPDIDQAQLPPSPPASAKQIDDDFEGETLVDSPTTATTKTGSSGAEVDANEDTMVVDDGNFQDLKIDVDEEAERRERQARELRAIGWSEDAVFLFQKLGMRGLEPILPIEWVDDLETLPKDLFTARPDRVFLRPVHPAHGASFRAQLALSELFDLGGRVRDARITKSAHRKPHFHIKRAVQKYSAWAMKDGEVDDLWAQLPLFTTVTWNVKVHSSVGEEQMMRKLTDLYNAWYYALGIEQAEERGDENIPEVPTLYGVTASHTVMAFVSFTPPLEGEEKPKLRLIAMFDFGKDGYDVWHSLAIAIFVTHCRNRMIQLRDWLPQPEPLHTDDPDL